MRSVLSKFLILMLPSRVSIAHEIPSATESALSLVRSARAAILRDHFHGVRSTAAGLWMNEGGRMVQFNKLRDARLKHRSFVLAFGGTSITAGHDNYFNQTYV